MAELNVLGVAELADQTCSARGCDSDPIAVRVALVPDKGLGIIWLCNAHALETHAAGVDVHLIPHDCGAGDQTKCGAAATHIAIIDAGLPLALRVIGVCPRHILEESGH